MMHGRGKSDLRHSSCEAGEQGGANRCGAGGAKGNACQQSTCRAQHRVSVSQALERIRQVAALRTRGKSRMHQRARTDLRGLRLASAFNTAA